MLRTTLVVCAAEFKQKSRWSSVWPNMRYGAMYLNYSAGRQIPMRGVNWVTRDSNRLTNFKARYGSVVADLDVKKNEEELNIPLEDVRWNDHRRIFWICNFCGSPYRKNVCVRTKFHAGCNYCKGRHASEVRQAELKNDTVQSRFPDLVKDLVDNGKIENIAGLSCTSKFRAEWKCRGCGGAYRSSIRSRTGLVEAGQCALHPDITSWAAYCPSCSWQQNLKKVGEATLKEGQFLGLDVQAKSVAAAIPRRKKLVA